MSLTFPVGNLLPEVLALIFSQSSTKAVLKAESVNKHWHKVANQPIVWQNLIRQHCPYLMTEKNAEYLKDPKALYKSEFGIKAIERHYKYIVAAENGRIDVLQALLTQPGPQISAENKGVFLARAAKAGDLNQVQVLLTNAGDEISANDKYFALLAATTSYGINVIDIVRVLLTQITAKKKGKALEECVLSFPSPTTEVVQELSKGVDISYIIKALKNLTAYHRQDRVDAILSQRGHELSPAQLVEALGTNGARDYRASKRNIARSLALERTGELNNQEDDEAQPDRKRPRN